MTAKERGGLRERKKAATRDALSEAALRLALAHGPENVRVDDIAEAAGVSPRTYNNYFASREQAIVSAVTAERTLRVAAALRARPGSEPLATAVIEAVVEQYTSEPDGEALAMIMSTPRLRAEFIDAMSALRPPLASAIADRIGDTATMAPAVLAAAVSAAARVAVERWVDTADDDRSTGAGLVVVTADRTLPSLLREALGQVAPALEAADPTRRSTEQS
ncbi:transcriptional regulator, tetR family [Saccharomonospora marina XMU15]|uniref:Transcriptional regulator, tetR family n=1 Tax=Saccharomonospora marina XMU15 TaxID=882083 RepID=H5X9F9_9PSEU|nr:TetR/AcrR family transcriptional regulator [Saccharomonospora marina]EHR50324.1 transcriptional regulator, tetR family [Saccharomonospora marina XMU15]